VKAVEDEQGQADPGDDAPGEQAVESKLQVLRDPAVSHEGVQHPKGDVGEEEEGDQLAAGFGVLLGATGAMATRGLGNDQALM